MCRWHRRRRRRALDNRIDDRIREKTLSRLEANRTHSLAKLPAAALASEQSVLRPLPRLTGAHSAYSSEESLPRPRQTCIRSADQRLPCGCPDCVVFARSSTLAPSLSGSAIASAAAVSSTHGTSSHRQPRGRHSMLPPGLRVLSLDSSASRAQRRTDENVHRAASIRTPSPRVVSPFEYYSASAGFDRSAPPGSAYSPGTTVGMGIMVATHTSALGCPSPALTTPSLGFSTPLCGSPAPSLSDDAGATTLNPIVEQERSAAAANLNSPVDVAATRGHLGSSLAHMHVSPLVHDAAAAAGIPVSTSAVSVYESPLSSPATITQAHFSKVTPGAGTGTAKGSELPFSPRADGEDEKQQQKQVWFTDVVWYHGDDGPSACDEGRV
ncbi:hypothetical protein OH76DRAFT_1411311 [Lentinus brumalis]|uniref:Uncharacterized protein n=1 Tax=Lentinus brumalis TaxID=2498619 RepID=A0A371CPS9_9APHY|nr:hypothetical protein OH76DRAFT_1411311 [Polyporus brumalis]